MNSANGTTLKRIQREIRDISHEDLGDMELIPHEQNMFLWTGSLPGPSGSPYEGGTFKVDIVLAPDYPFTAPKVSFKTRIYHMNVAPTGGICMDILKQNWSPALSLFKVLLSLSSLLTDPNPFDPLVPVIATQYKSNRKLHDETARQWTELYARTSETIRKNGTTTTIPLRSKGKGKGSPVQDPQPSINISSSSLSGQVGAVPSTSKASRKVISELIELSDSEIELVSSTPGTDPIQRPRRKRNRSGSGSTHPRLHGETQVKRRRHSEVPSEDVIIIDD